MNAILGEKLGMTQVFDEGSRAIPVTIVKAGPVRVVQVKDVDKDGYGAVQIAFKELDPRKVGRASAGHYGRAGVPPHKHLVEVRVDDPAEYEVGQEIGVGEVFEKDTKADVTAVSRGKGFSGVVKRHGFSGQGASHGAHKIHRAPGAIGACATPARVFRGKRLPGRMGGERTTVLNLDVVDVDGDRNLIMLRGAIPGAKGSIVLIREAVSVRA